jgi:DNA-binding LytR/AlgR family response regulator
MKNLESLLINNEQEQRRIIVHTILFVMTEDYLSTFYLINKDIFICSKSLKEILNNLPDYFFQISRSCVVNLNEVVSIKRPYRKITLSNSRELTVSIRRIKAFHSTFASQTKTFTR